MTLHEYILEARIVANQNNITVFKGLPFKLSCTSLGRPELLHVMWIKEGVFVKNDDQHDISSSKPSNNSQNHKLIVRSALKSGTYKCLMVNTNGRIVDSVEQHVFVEGMQLRP